MKPIFIFSFFSLFSVTFANTHYISNIGENSNSGSRNEPWQTLQYAADQVQPGDSVLVENGTYAGFSISTAGDSTHPIVFKALGTQVVVNEAAGQDNIAIYLAHYVVIDGFLVRDAQRAGISVLGYADNECMGVVLRNNTCTTNGRWGIFTGYAKDILIANNETAYSGTEHGIYVSNSSDNPVIRNNTAHHNHGSGIQINADPALDGDGIITNAIIENNICFENGTGGGAALNFASIRNSVIKNNILYENHAGGMAFWDDDFGNGMGCKNNRIYNNSVVMPADGRWALNVIHNSSGNEIINNILIHQGSRGGLEIDHSSMDGLNSDYNIMSKISTAENWISLNDWQSQNAQDIHSFSADIKELFVSSNDLHLRENAPAIDAGKNLSNVSDDFEGDSRPYGKSVDIGADEYTITFIPDQSAVDLPEQIEIIGSYPNPCLRSVKVQFWLKASANIIINLYNVAGQKIISSGNLFKTRGLQTYLFDTTSLASGNYFFRIISGRQTSKYGKLILIK